MVAFPQLVFLALFAGLTLGDVNLRVYSDGSGEFTSIQAALDSLSPGLNASLGRTTLHLLGYFRERVYVYSNFSLGGNKGVSFIGDGTSPLEALIVYNESGAEVGTFSSFSVTVDADGFTASNIALANDAGAALYSTLRISDFCEGSSGSWLCECLHSSQVGTTRRSQGRASHWA